jgi:hypothetical protein
MANDSPCLFLGVKLPRWRCGAEAVGGTDRTLRGWTRRVRTSESHLPSLQVAGELRSPAGWRAVRRALFKLPRLLPLLGR